MKNLATMGTAMLVVLIAVLGCSRFSTLGNVDLYEGDDDHPTLLEFCLYMAFWPTVALGPICRLSTMLPQFRDEFSDRFSIVVH